MKTLKIADMFCICLQTDVLILSPWLAMSPSGPGCSKAD